MNKTFEGGLKRLLLLLVCGLAISCEDRNGLVGARFRLRDDSPLPSWFVLPEGMRRNQVSITIIRYEATSTPQWKARFVIQDKTNRRVLKEVIGYGYWHPDSERAESPAGTYPNWVVIE